MMKPENTRASTARQKRFQKRRNCSINHKPHRTKNGIIDGRLLCMWIGKSIEAIFKQRTNQTKQNQTKRN